MVDTCTVETVCKLRILFNRSSKDVDVLVHRHEKAVVRVFALGRTGWNADGVLARRLCNKLGNFFELFIGMNGDGGKKEGDRRARIQS